MAQPKIYWEKQESSLCGVHCVNNLLQGSYFSEWDLSNIAAQLYEEERKLMSAGGAETAEFLSFMAQDSHHVDDSGNFSIEVIKKALSTFNLTAVSNTSETTKSARENPCGEEGFICNLSNHWFSIRKLNRQWFNVNSLLKNGPEFISDFYLSAFLAQLTNEGYSIFVVTGKFPVSMAGSEGSGRGNWYDIADVVARKNVTSKETVKKPTAKRPLTSEEEFEAAVKASLDDSKTRQAQQRERAEKDELDAALRLSMQRPPPLASAPSEDAGLDEDAQLQEALKLSMRQATPKNSSSSNSSGAPTGSGSSSGPKPKPVG